MDTPQEGWIFDYPEHEGYKQKIIEIQGDEICTLPNNLMILTIMDYTYKFTKTDKRKACAYLELAFELMYRHLNFFRSNYNFITLMIKLKEYEEKLFEKYRKLLLHQPKNLLDITGEYIENNIDIYKNKIILLPKDLIEKFSFQEFISESHL